MPIRRRFIDWSQPAIPAAADYLLSQYTAGGAANLGGVLLAVPGGLAGRRLLEILVERADERSLVLTPPQILTAGELPERLYSPKRPFADELTQQLAWVRALRDTEPAKLSALAPHPPPADDLEAWLALGAMLAELHRELAADALNFADLVEQAPQLADFNEQERWKLLAEVQQHYLRILDDLQLWDKQTARLVAIDRHECTAAADIVLVGTVDMNRAQRAMLEQVADRVTALVFAPETLAERFDQHGCLAADRWQNVIIPLRREQISVVDSPGDQADAVMRAIASLDGRYAAEELTIGAADERLVPYLLQRLHECELPARFGVGTPLVQSGPRKLLASVADYLAERSFAALAALVRHADVARWLRAQRIETDPAAACDRYFAEHVPASAPRFSPREGDTSGLRPIVEAIDKLLAPCTAPRRPLSDWCEPLRAVLLAVYGGTPIDTLNPSGRMTAAACQAVFDALCSQRELPAGLAPEASCAEALRLALRSVEGQSLPSPGGEPAIELLGWLELPLDDAPALVVAGVNEGIVPKAVNADPFLPDQLRRRLQLLDNERRYARDAYALCMLAASRRALHVVAGRRTAEGDPTWPSRLLLACDDAELASRARALFDPHATAPPVQVARGIRDGSSLARFEPPRPLPLAEAVRSMRVTEFRDYIACPYRYYLRHRLKLQAVDDVAEELDARQFGNLLHESIQLCPWGEIADSTDADEIDVALRSGLDKYVRRQFGASPLPTVLLQVEQARQRLAALARWQADWRKSGWRIRFVEQAAAESGASLTVDGRTMDLRGRIDRIDVHVESGEHIVFDYKSSDTAETPEKKHRENDKWIDLQLPLYRQLAKAMGVEGPLRLAYIVLPKSVRETGERVAEWTDEDLAAADQAAFEVVRNVWREVFWPPNTEPPKFAEEFAAICGDGQLIAALDEAAGEEDQP